jgi:hypothetical protein
MLTHVFDAAGSLLDFDLRNGGGRVRHFLEFLREFPQELALTLPDEPLAILRKSSARLRKSSACLNLSSTIGLSIHGSRDVLAYCLRQVVPFDHWMTRLSDETTVPSMFHTGPKLTEMWLVSLA